MASFVLEGEVDWPFPKSAGMMMKYCETCEIADRKRSHGSACWITLFGFRDLSSPISQRLSDIAVQTSERAIEDALIYADIQNTK